MPELPSTKKSIGVRGEAEAVQYLKKKGYTILERNLRVAGAEIDIIAQKQDILHFIEVKTRKTENFGLPEEYVDRRKIRKIIRAAKLFSERKSYQNRLWQLDIISIIHCRETFRITHWENVFEE